MNNKRFIKSELRMTQHSSDKLSTSYTWREIRQNFAVLDNAILIRNMFISFIPPANVSQ